MHPVNWQSLLFVQKSMVLDGLVGGWMDGRAGLRIAYTNQKRHMRGQCLKAAFNLLPTLSTKIYEGSISCPLKVRHYSILHYSLSVFLEVGYSHQI